MFRIRRIQRHDQRRVPHSQLDISLSTWKQHKQLAQKLLDEILKRTATPPPLLHTSQKTNYKTEKFKKKKKIICIFVGTGQGPQTDIFSISRYCACNKTAICASASIWLAPADCHYTLEHTAPHSLQNLPPSSLAPQSLQNFFLGASTAVKYKG